MGTNIEISHEASCTQHLQVIYTRKMEERKIFMEELKDVRRDDSKRVYKIIKDSIGPIWYQVLSEPQRKALDTLKNSIHQDLLEMYPKRTKRIIHSLGIYPLPKHLDLIDCVYAGRDDPKETFQYLFVLKYGHYIHGRRSSYDLNARLMLSAIFYLGLDGLLKLLEARFQPATDHKTPLPKPKRKKEPPLISPYLAKPVQAKYYLPKKIIRQPPRPLPNLDEIDDPYEEEPLIRKPPPPPPPPPPPKKRLPRSYCDKIAGVPKIRAYNLGNPSSLPVKEKKKKIRAADLMPQEPKKVYGIDTGQLKKSMRKKKPNPLSTGLWNAQYLIQGVYNINDRVVFIVSNVTILPPLGELIHGGYALVQGTHVNIHCGFAAIREPDELPPCDCLENYQESVFRYLKDKSKCKCGHHYDYGNEPDTFPSDDVPYFEKPTRSTPFRFNYNTIYEMHPKMIYVEKEFKRIWETDSVIHESENAHDEKKEPKKKRKIAPSTCLGRKPSQADFLRCALRMMRNDNIAARLPDVHLAPELKEWMRRRIDGPYTPKQKKKFLCKTKNHWDFLKFVKGLSHVAPPQDPAYLGLSTWAFKQELTEHFRKFSNDYKQAVYNVHAKLNNLLWATMCQAEFPDKKFREIFFSYLWARVPDVQLMHPYCVKETADRMLKMAKKRYRCPPAGLTLEDVAM